MDRLRDAVAAGRGAHRRCSCCCCTGSSRRAAGGRRASGSPAGSSLAVGAGPHLPGPGQPDRRARRASSSGVDGAAGRVPAARPERGLPGHLHPAAHRPPRRRPALRQRGHPPRAARPARRASRSTSQPFALEGSGGSTPLRITLSDGHPAPYLFGKLYAVNHLRSDRWYKLGRTLLYGGLEDERAFNSVRRLVQHEDYALRLLRDAGLPVPTPYGIVEITPEREYLLVTEFFARRRGGRRRARRRAAHRRGPGGRAPAVAGRPRAPRHQAGQPARARRTGCVLIDSAFTEVRPSPVAAGGRPGQHDARPGAEQRRPDRSTSGRCGPSPWTRSPRPSRRRAASRCRRSCAG